MLGGRGWIRRTVQTVLRLGHNTSVASRSEEIKRSSPRRPRQVPTRGAEATARKPRADYGQGDALPLMPAVPSDAFTELAGNVLAF